VPFVNIIIPYKDNIDYLFLSLKSVFNQSYKKFRILIIYDDEKKNDLKKIIKFISNKEIKKKFKIKIIVNKKNLGAGESRNKAIRLSESKYIAFLDSDDTWHKKKLEKQVNFMEKNRVILSHTSYNVVNEFGEKISFRKSRKKSNYKQILNSCDIGLSTVMINLKFMKSYNLKFPKIKTKEDYILWLKILKIVPHINGLNFCLTNYRKRKNSLSSNNITNLLNGFRVYRDYEKMSILESLFRLIILSMNFFKKKITNDFKFYLR
tara:strand:+ start:18799 stop:19590 length:792 start_codon:yes stop_codon:yes gene_type:complete